MSERRVGSGDPSRGPPGPTAERLRSLDAFRGLTVAAMIFVNNPGTWRHLYPALRHADWNGCTLADLVFPFFLFIVGVAITFSLAAAQRDGAKRLQLLVKVLRRTIIIFGLGLFLNGFPFFNFGSLRIPGVLQRIALCYCFASLTVMSVGTRGQAGITALLLVGYWIALRWIPVPGHDAGALQRGANLAAYIDSLWLHDHMLRSHWDPEGVLSTLPALATTLCGVLTGHWLRSPRAKLERTVGLFVAGNVGIMLGLIVDFWFPINKSLWTSSYVLFTAGAALNVLGLCYWLIDVRGYQRWAQPFVIYGTNPILAYLLPSLLDKALLSGSVTRRDGTTVLLKTHVFERWFLPWASRAHASVLYAATDVLLWLGVMAILYRRRIFIKI
ncbi:MAG TPA: DUF5009 domain-containing protein [Candidatus Kryptonia bacterium]|nr:DUF5009 domain-containing protein [Candidatus Kryptonia bacterium]